MTRSFVQLSVGAILVAVLAGPGVAQPASPNSPDTRRMDEVVKFYADDPPRFMGVVLVARGADVLFTKGYGMANLEWSVPHTPTTKIPIGSNSKQFTAAAILLLEERGKLRVTDSIKLYFPDAPAAWDAITFHHLLSHTSGLIDTAPAERGALSLPARPDKTLERFRDVPLQFAPGTSYSYSNAGYQLLAYLIERTSGQGQPPDLDAIRGNHVILEIGPRLYATYAHLKPGSLRVAMGQRVTRGQVIGQVGNTGASGAPHLHFQLSEAPDVTSDGVPYAHASFDVVGRCQQTGQTLADLTCAHVPPEMHRGEIPLNFMLVRFHEK